MSSLTRFVQQVIPFTISSHRIGQVIFVSEVILFSCLITVLICIKNPLLFDPCISISNKLILVFSYIALCVYCFYVISMFHFYCTVMYVDVRLSHPNKDYLLTYLRYTGIQKTPCRKCFLTNFSFFGYNVSPLMRKL